MNRSDDRTFPGECEESLSEPPTAFTDAEGRRIEIRPYDGEFEAVVEMYARFDPADRAQGIPPATESRVRDWFDSLLDGLNVIAWCGEEVVGHATLVPDRDRCYELAIFVHRDYQRAGIGSELMYALLAHGRANGVEKVWLTVERWNSAAVALYEAVGFETVNSESFELEMALSL